MEHDPSASIRSAGAVPIADLPTSDIEPNPYQPRTVFNEVALHELAASIEEHGVLQPLIVRVHGDRYQLVSGERRLQASRRANLPTVPAVIHDFDDRTMLEVALVENIQREDISPLEAARAYKRLMDEFGLTQQQVGQRVGKSRPAVSNTLRLLKLPLMIQQSLACGDITEGHARSLLSIEDPEWQARVWNKIVQENLSVRDSERLAYGHEPEVPAPRSAVVSRETSNMTPDTVALPAELRALETRLRTLLGTRVRIRGTLNGGTVTVDYFDAQDLQRIAELLGAP